MEIFIVWGVYIHFELIMHLKKHERLCNNHDYFGTAMPAEDKNILKYNHVEKSLKVVNIIYMDLESLLIKQLHKIILKNHIQKKSLWLFNKFSQIIQIESYRQLIRNQ